MASYLDAIPFSGIMRIRDMMFGIDKPFRLDQLLETVERVIESKSPVAQS